MSDSFHHSESIWYQSEPLDVPYCPTQFLDFDFFAFLTATSFSKYTCPRTFKAIVHSTSQQEIEFKYDSLMQYILDKPVKQQQRPH
jgi:hypothetical protein